MNDSIKRILLSPAGFLMEISRLARDGSRNIHNKIRFRDSEIEAGCRIDSNSRIAPKTHIFGNCLVNNSSVSSYTYVGRNTVIQNASVGQFCSIANEVCIGLGAHPLNELSTSPLFYRINNPLNIKLADSDSVFSDYRQIEIGNDVWIGARAILLDGVTIGHGAVIAANSVVTKDIPPYAISAGVPARVVKYRFDPEKIKYLLDLGWWTWDLEEIKSRFPEINLHLNHHSVHLFTSETE